jgi:DNA-binding NarL/FixJ family response regulator
MNKPHPIQLMIADSHQLFCECLASLLDERGSFDVVARPTTLFDALERASALKPDILLVGKGFSADQITDFIRQIKLESPEIRLLILGLSEGEPLIARCREAGANGVLLKEASLEDFLSAIHAIHRGETVFSSQSSSASRAIHLSTSRDDIIDAESDALTAREAEILQLIAEGLSNQQIAHRLYISTHTVKNHVHNMLEKMKAHHRSEAVYQALCKGLVKLPPQP